MQWFHSIQCSGSVLFSGVVLFYSIQLVVPFHSVQWFYSIQLAVPFHSVSGSIPFSAVVPFHWFHSIQCSGSIPFSVVVLFHSVEWFCSIPFSVVIPFGSLNCSQAGRVTFPWQNSYLWNVIPSNPLTATPIITLPPIPIVLFKVKDLVAKQHHCYKSHVYIQNFIVNTHTHTHTHTHTQCKAYRICFYFDTHHYYIVKLFMELLDIQFQQFKCHIRVGTGAIQT